MELIRVTKISDTSGLCLGEVQNGAEDVLDNVWIRWGVFTMGYTSIGWARKEEVDPLWEGSSEELRGDGADVHRKSGVPILHGLRLDEMWELEYQMRNAMRGSRVRVRVYIHPDVRDDRVTSSEEGLEAGAKPPQSFTTRRRWERICPKFGT
jgi:hypothetical protein